jgi:hypothetical protein
MDFCFQADSVRIQTAEELLRFQLLDTRSELLQALLQR